MGLDVIPHRVLSWPTLLPSFFHLAGLCQFPWLVSRFRSLFPVLDMDDPWTPTIWSHWRSRRAKQTVLCSLPVISPQELSRMLHSFLRLLPVWDTCDNTIMILRNTLILTFFLSVKNEKINSAVSQERQGDSEGSAGCLSTSRWRQGFRKSLLKSPWKTHLVSFTISRLWRLNIQDTVCLWKSSGVTVRQILFSLAGAKKTASPCFQQSQPSAGRNLSLCIYEYESRGW